MSQQYLHIQKEHVRQAWARRGRQLERELPAQRQGDCLQFRAFGCPCLLCQEEIFLDGERLTGPEGILVALYARHVRNAPLRLHPLQSFKELPNSAPYHGAFTARAEQSLAAHAPAISDWRTQIVECFSGHLNDDAPSGDFSFTLYPLPRIPLYYIIYLPDEEFPAAVTCLFAADAASQLPVDGLADVAEITAKRIVKLIERDNS
jgi:hypothetical protein